MCITDKMSTGRPTAIFMRYMHGMMFIFAMLAAHSVAIMPAHAHVSSPPDHEDNKQAERIVIPLEQGELRVATLINHLYQVFDQSPPEQLRSLDWAIDARSVVGRAQLDMIERWSQGLVTVDVDDQHVVLLMHTQRAAQLAEQKQQTITQWLKQWTAHLKVVDDHSYGITFVTDEEQRRSLMEMKHVPDRVVVLVHGLDDPGWMWRDLIPVLRERQYKVARFEYPNDESITRAADFLAINLMTLRARGVKRVDLIAHSMGGLLCRDVLTREAYHAGDGAGPNHLPAIDRLIMVGTPNHGSHLARLRGVTELREHVQRLFDSEAPLRSPFLDGDGRAGEDLLPGSAFLTDLNARGRPKHTHYTIIAGRTSPINERNLNELSQTVRKLAQHEDMPDWLRETIKAVDPDKAAPALRAIVENVGDGLVTIKSARLQGVKDFVIVDGNHVSVLINMMGDDDRTPPAISIILNRLARPVAGADLTSD